MKTSTESTAEFLKYTRKLVEIIELDLQHIVHKLDTDTMDSLYHKVVILKMMMDILERCESDEYTK